MGLETKWPLKVWERNWKMYVYTHKRIEIDSEEPDRMVKKVTKGVTKTKKK